MRLTHGGNGCQREGPSMDRSGGDAPHDVVGEAASKAGSSGVGDGGSRALSPAVDVRIWAWKR